MTHPTLTAAEARRLADTIATEVRALGATGRISMPQATRRHIRARVLKTILDERRADNSHDGAQVEG